MPILRGDWEPPVRLYILIPVNSPFRISPTVNSRCDAGWRQVPDNKSTCAAVVSSGGRRTDSLHVVLPSRRHQKAIYGDMTTFLRLRYRSYVGDNVGVMNEMTTLGTEVLADHVYREGEMEYDREALDEQVE